VDLAGGRLDGNSKIIVGYDLKHRVSTVKVQLKVIERRAHEIEGRASADPKI
jgi:hypothetical protein